MKKQLPFTLATLLMLTPFNEISAQRQQQPRGRGVVAVQNGTNVFISWRRLAQEPENATYNIYVDGTKINSSPLKNTNYTTTSSVIKANSKIAVTIIKNGTESELSVPYEIDRKSVV